MSSSIMRRLLPVLLGLLGAGALAANGLSGEDENRHGQHDPPGNAALAYPLAEGVRRVGGDNTPTGGHVAAEGKRLYVGAYGLGMRIYDISRPERPALIGQYLPGLRADAVPDAAVFDGRHIATLNGTRRVSRTDLRTDKTEFLDVTDAARPKLLWTFVGPDDGEAHNGDIVDKRRLWLPSGGAGTNGLRIYDLAPLLGTPAAAPAILFRGDPAALWESSPYRGDRPVGARFTHTHDVTAYVDYPLRMPDGSKRRRDVILLAEGGDYLNDGGNTGSIFVIDVTNPRQPVVINRWLHEAGPGHDPIRYHHEAQLLDGDRQLMLVTDEDLHNGCGKAGGVTAVRLSDDLTRAEELSEWFIPAGTPAPVCSVHVFSSEGSLAFFGSYNAGLQVVDYEDPARPRRVGQFVAPGTTAWGALERNGLVYVGDVSRGLDVFELDDPGLLLKLKLRVRPLD